MLEVGKMDEVEIQNDRYREAYQRIESSIETEHFFEAITIEESILSDRLCSFLRSTNGINDEEANRQPFAQLIISWKLATSAVGVAWEECSELISQADNWRKQRNKYIHGLVKFPNNKAKLVKTKEFIDGAKCTAIEGKRLANEVSEWRKRQSSIKRRLTNASKVSNGVSGDE